MTLAIVQHGSDIRTAETPGSLTLGSTPTPGNYLLVFIGCNSLTKANLNLTDWEIVHASQAVGGNTTTYFTILLGRIVQSGDTVTTPSVSSGSGFTYWANAYTEISGGSGDISADIHTLIPTLQGVTNGVTVPPLPAYNADTLAIAFTAVYNASVDPSFSGSGWTTDEAQHNNSNFGSVGLAHKVLGAGDTLDGAWTTGGSTPDGSFVLMMNPTQPGTVHLRRMIYEYDFSTASVDLGFTPRVGNLLLCCIGYRDGSSASPTMNTGWLNSLEVDATAGHPYNLIASHYVQSGETDTYTILSGVFDFLAEVYFEIGGVSGVLASDVTSMTGAGQASGATFTSGTRNTDGANQIVLQTFFNYDATSAVAVPTGWGELFSNSSSSTYGASLAGVKIVVTSGTSVGGDVFTPTDTSHPQSNQLIFLSPPGSAPPAPSVTESMALSDLLTASSSGVASAAITENMSLMDTLASPESIGPRVTIIIIGA